MGGKRVFQDLAPFDDASIHPSQEVFIRHLTLNIRVLVFARTHTRECARSEARAIINSQEKDNKNNGKVRFILTDRQSYTVNG